MMEGLFDWGKICVGCRFVLAVVASYMTQIMMIVMTKATERTTTLVAYA